MQTNRIMAIVTAIVVAILVLGANLGQFMTLEHTLRAQAGDDALSWVDHLVDAVPDLSRVMQTGTASTEQLLALARELGDHGKSTAVFFSGDGTAVATVGPRPWSNRPDWSAQVAANVQKAIATGAPQKAVFATDWHAADAMFIGSAFVPIVDGSGRAKGVVVSLLDRSESAQSFYAAFVRLSLLLTVVFTVALALLAIGFFFVRRQVASSRQQVDYLAQFDQLTGLHNRGGFRTRLKELRRDGTVSSERAAVLYFDLDSFKAINDTQGHSAGDAVLRHVGRAINGCLKPGDIGVRFGGDEFVVICTVQSSTEAMALAERICTAIAQPVSAVQTVIKVHASCGICTGMQCGGDIDQGLHHADLALYQAKLDGRNAIREFTPELETRVRRRIMIEEAVRDGLRNEAFELHYQPLINRATRQCLGFEALLRLNTAEGGQISPAEFIPIAETTGLVQQIGQWVLATAAAEAAKWPEHLYVSVNLSARQFDKENLVSIVSEVLSRTGLAPHRLELEVTESLLIENTESVGRQLSALRALGISIAMDDFGTGYSSLGYLWRYGFDKLKIDRSFVMGLDTDTARSKEVIDTIVVLAHRLDMTVTVEGIETETQAEAISNLACDQMQGYLFGRPMPAENLPGFILGNVAEAGAKAANAENTGRSAKAS